MSHCAAYAVNVLSLVGSSKCTHSGTGHLDSAYDNLLGSNEFETFKAEVAHLDALAEAEAGHVDVQLFGDEVVGSLHVDLANHSHELTTGAYTFSKALGCDGHTDNDGTVGYYLIEVNVEHVVLHGVALNFLYDSLVLYAVNVDVHEIYVRGEVNLVDFLLVYYEVGSYGQTVFVTLFSVHHAGNEAVLANFLGGFLADDSANATIDRKFSHCFLNFVLL